MLCHPVCLFIFGFECKYLNNDNIFLTHAFKEENCVSQEFRKFAITSVPAASPIPSHNSSDSSPTADCICPFGLARTLSRHVATL